MTRSKDAREDWPLRRPARPLRSRRRPHWQLALVFVAGAVLATSALLGGWWLHGWLERREALSLAQQGRFAEAEPLLQRVLERQGNDLAIVKALALGQLEANKLSEAELSLGRWCALRPNDAEPFRRRMDLRLRLKRLPEAIADGQRVLELEPDQDTLRRQMAQWLKTTGRLTEAEQECRRCLERQPKDPELLYLLAEIYQGQGRNAEAASILDPLVRNYPRFTAARLGRAILYYDANQPAQAIPLLRQVVAQDPAFQQIARYYLSLALDRTGQTDEAQRLMGDQQGRQVLDFLGGNGSSANLDLQVRLAESLLGSGKPDDALRLLEKILEQDPNSAAAQQLLAAPQAKQGQTTPQAKPGQATRTPEPRRPGK
jgi:predicted Zn-dependent protease